MSPKTVMRGVTTNVEARAAHLTENERPGIVQRAGMLPVRFSLLGYVAA